MNQRAAIRGAETGAAREWRIIDRIRRGARQLRAEMVNLPGPAKVYVSETGLTFDSKAHGLGGVLVGTFTRDIGSEDLEEEAIFTARAEGVL